MNHQTKVATEAFGAAAGAFTGIMGLIKPVVFTEELTRTVILAGVGWATTLVCNKLYGYIRLKIKK